MNVADGYVEVLRTIAQAMQPDPELHLPTWSEQHVHLPKGTPFPGPYRLARTPYARRILECLSPGHPSSVVVAMVASQMLKTQTAINAMLGWMDLAPGNILALEPSDKLAKRLSSRIAKAIAACDPVAAKVAKPRSRDNRNTIDVKEFDGGQLHIVTSQSANNLAEMSARYLFADEVDRMAEIPQEGHAVDLALTRLTQYRGISKAYLVSTPLVLGFSRIADLHDQGTREQYHVPCPHCGELHPLQREHFRYDYDAAARRVRHAWFVCPACGAEFEEHHKASMLLEHGHGGAARWVARSDGDGETVSFHLPAYYAPPGTVTWCDLGLQLARALERKQLGDPAPLGVYTNTREGLPYSSGESVTTAQALMERAEPYPPRVVPDQALVVTAFADTQPNRLEVTVEAWGPGLEHWVLDHVTLWGSPAESPHTPGSVWQQLEQLRRTPWLHASGRALQLSAYGIDSGGANTQDVYNYAALTERYGCHATKGSSQRERPIIASAPSKVDVMWQGQRLPQGCKLWQLGTDTAKDHLFNRLHLKGGPGAHHFHQALPLEYFEGLLSESVQTRWHKGKAVRDYVKPPGARNEPLDCAVGNLAMAHYLGLHRMSPLDWARLRERLIPSHGTPDLFAPAPAPAPAAAAAAEVAPAQPPARPAAAAEGRAAEPAPSPANAQPAAGEPAAPAAQPLQYFATAPAQPRLPILPRRYLRRG
jgi:phage terminase large subunit GpA-like protein